MGVKPDKVWYDWYGNAERARDVVGVKIDRAAFGDRNSKYGWEIDHIIPRSKGGSNDIGNLRPLHWRNNEAKGDKFDGAWQVPKW